MAKKIRKWSFVRIGIYLLIAFFLYMYLRNGKEEENITFSNYPEDPTLEVEMKGHYYNLLLISVDTLRPDYLSTNGYDLSTSPSVDKLINRSLYFSHAVTPIPRTTQALACLMTGSYPHKTGIRYLWGSLSREMITLAEILKKVNYQTIAVVSNHVLLPKRGLNRGFDVYDFGTDKRDAIKTTRAAIRHLNNINSGRPFFLWVHYIDPHVPYYPPKKIAIQFDPYYEGRYKTHFGEEKGGIGERAYPEDIGKERAVFHNDLGDTVNKHIRRLYAADIKLTDIGIKQLLQEVQKYADDNLLIIFTADHGESLGEHNYYYEHGAYVYNAGIRVPLAFILLKNHSMHLIGRTHDRVSLIDVFPTTLDLLGIEVQSHHLDRVDGRSLLSYWQKKPLKLCPTFAESGKAFFPESIKRRIKFDISGRFRCVIFDNWKLIWTPYQKDEWLYELYNIKLDPNETKNLYNPNHPKAELLRKVLDQWMSQQKQKVRESKPTKKDLEVLKSLGYIK